VNVFILEDNDIVIDVFKKTLSSKGHSVLIARNPEDAARIPKRTLASMDLMIADQFLPGATGAQMVAKIRESCPGLPVLFVSATPVEFWSETDQSTLLGFSSGTVEFLQKPFLPCTLIAAVERLICSALPGPELRVAEVVN
jgi:DNA-binding response OmpR family regulator